MSDPRTSASWQIEPHTAAKLKILGAYLRAWFSIIGVSRDFDRAIYIDGFAGPGRYKQGQDGSPIIALKAALDVPARAAKIPIEFHFVELNPDCCAALNANIDHLKQNQVIPQRIEIHVHERQTFLQAYDQQIRRRLQTPSRTPAFALVDPFGWTGMPMETLSALMKRPSTEILVNFMFEEINRFISHPQQEQNFERLFGCSEWRGASDLSGSDRKKFIHDLYGNQLRCAAGARYVRSFEMRNKRNATDYFLYFAGNHLLGLDKMKEAMWNVDRDGGFTFSDATDYDRAMLFEPEPDWKALRRLIAERFAKQRATVMEVKNFVIADTPFLASHYKGVLKEMEAEQALTYLGPPVRSKKGTFAHGSAVLEFL